MRAVVSPRSHGRRGGGCRSSAPARRSGGPRTHRPGSPQAGGAPHSWHWAAGHLTPLSVLLGMDRRALRARRLSGVGTGSMTAVVPPPVGDRPRRRRPRVLRVVGARGPSRRPRRGPGSSARFPCSRSCRSEALGSTPRVTAARLDVGATGLGQRADGSIRLLTRSAVDTIPNYGIPSQRTQQLWPSSRDRREVAHASRRSPQPPGSRRTTPR
jgi:hypothetical protein